MKLLYETPEINIRKYEFPSNTLYTTTSPVDPDLGDGDDYGELPDVFA